MKAETKRHRMDRRIVELLRAGKGTNEISRNLHVSKKRIVEVRKRAQERGYLREECSLPPCPAVLFPEIRDGRSERTSATEEALEPHRAWIEERLRAGWYPVTVWEELPVRVARSNFYRFLNRHRLRDLGRRARVVPEIVSGAGEVLQLDWGKLRVAEIDGRRKTVWMFIGVLGYSRHLVVRLVHRCDTETTLAAIASMFEELGGVPKRVTTDNPKCISLLAGQYEAVLNPIAERFSAHYNFIFECLPPRTPQLKGKVERQMKYVRRLYQAHGDDWWGIEESQHYLDKKLTLANRRKHGTTGLSPSVVLEQQERETLTSLPTERYQIEQYHSGKVRQDGCVRFDGKYYSVGSRYCGHEVVLIASASQVSIYHKGNLIEVHDRLTDPHRSKSIKAHHKEPWELACEDESLYRTRARDLGEWVEELVVLILAQGNGFIDYRKIWGILSLDKQFSAHSINDACQLAVEQERFSYYAVREFATHFTALDNSTPNQEQTRQLSLIAPQFVHDIKEYSQRVSLTLIQGGNNE